LPLVIFDEFSNQLNGYKNLDNLPMTDEFAEVTVELLFTSSGRDEAVSFLLAHTHFVIRGSMPHHYMAKDQKVKLFSEQQQRFQ
jgi:hypothetical protein